MILKIRGNIQARENMKVMSSRGLFISHLVRNSLCHMILVYYKRLLKNSIRGAYIVGLFLGLWYILIFDLAR